MLAIHVLIQGEAGAQLVDRGRWGAENEVHEVAAVERASGVAELPAVHLLDLFDGGAIFFEFAFQTVNHVFRAFFTAFDIEDQQSFVSVVVAHWVLYWVFSVGFES